MAFEITDNLVRIYQEGIDGVIDQLGKKVIFVGSPTETICPNCYYDARRKRSTGRLNPNNTNPSGPLNIFFENGTTCPVCRGRGKLTQTENRKEILATVKWNPRDYVSDSTGTSNVILPDGICKIKTYSSYTDDIKNAKQILVAFDEQVEGAPNMAACTLLRMPSPRGLRYNRYVEAYLEAVQEKTR